MSNAISVWMSPTLALADFDLGSLPDYSAWYDWQEGKALLLQPGGGAQIKGFFEVKDLAGTTQSVTAQIFGSLDGGVTRFNLNNAFSAVTADGYEFNALNQNLGKVTPLVQLGITAVGNADNTANLRFGFS